MLEICSGCDAMLEVYYDGVGYADREKLARIHEYVPAAPMARYIAGTRRGVDDVLALFEERKAPTDKVQAIFRYGGTVQGNVGKSKKRGAGY